MVAAKGRLPGSDAEPDAFGHRAPGQSLTGPEGQPDANPSTLSVADFLADAGDADPDHDRPRLRRDLTAAGIRINCIAPGLIDTPIYGQGDASEEFKDKLKRDVLFPKRLGTSDEFASMACELLANSYMNAETIRVDGGVRMQPK